MALASLARIAGLRAQRVARLTPIICIKGLGCPKWNCTILDPFQMVDAMRRAQGNAMEALCAGPDECAYEIVASGHLCTLRRYPNPASVPDALIVPAPTKRPYIWGLAPLASVLRYCLA